MALAEELPGATPGERLAEIVSDWLDAFDTAQGSGDADGAAGLFLGDGHWRDLVAFTGHIRTMNGRHDIAARLRQTQPGTQAKGFQIAPHRTPPRLVSRAGTETIEAIFAFETATGPANGVLRLVLDGEEGNGNDWRAWVLATALEQITGHEERIGAHRPDGEGYSREFGGDNWLDLRNTAQAYAGHEPDVLVVGGAQAGLGIAACLGQLGVDTLVIDRTERIGDSWRLRYHALALHNQTHVNHLPYMPFPPNWPLYIPKDKLANWFETYAESMELNVWTATSLGGGAYDQAAGRWDITLDGADGRDRVVHPRHVVFATGVSGIPIHPDLPGLDDFAGDVMHSGAYLSGHQWAGRKALVLGTGNSGHDVAQDLHASGVDVTVIQRGTTLIASIDEAQKIYALYDEGPPTEDCDLLAAASPYPVLVQGYQMMARAMQAADKDLLDGLTARGFRLDLGPPDNTGLQMKYLRRGGGYCLNVGCSELIIDGQVGLMHYDQIERFAPEGVRLKDGTIVAADLLVTATGYENQQEVVRATLGDAVAEKIGPVWGFDGEGELRNMWRRTAQPGLWFTAGGLPHIRIYSKFLALQIKACEEGILDPAPPM